MYYVKETCNGPHVHIKPPLENGRFEKFGTSTHIKAKGSPIACVGLDLCKLFSCSILITSW